MKILLISSTVFPIPLKGYGGLEQIVYELACGLQKKGHQVAVIAPEGSILPDGIELIPVGLRELEESAYRRHQERLESGEFDVIGDHSWEAWSYISAMSKEGSLPIVHTIHTSPTIYQSPPPVQYPCLIGLSDQHCNDIRLHLKIDARRIYNGIDTSFYKRDPRIKRDSRYLWLARYTPEKGGLVAINMARRTRISLDCVGDVEIIGDQTYMERCRVACDGLRVRFMPGVPRSETLRLYNSHQALLFPVQWSEPFGLTVIEASACETPILTLRRGAMSELVRHGENGFIYDSEEDLEKAIRENVITEISPAACRKVAEDFTIERMVENYERIYTEVANGERW